MIFNKYEEMDANEMFLSYCPDMDRKTPVDLVEATKLLGKRVSDNDFLEEDKNS